MKKINFSPPDISQAEIDEVVDALKSGWITTGPKTKQLEKEIAEYLHVNKAVCLSSATIAMELILRLLGVGEGDEVITCAYTYTASASIIDHVGAKIVLVDTQKDSYEMDYDALKDAINENTKVIIPVDIAGKICNYDKIYKAIDEKKHLFTANSDLQKLYNRVIILSDAAHAFGAQQNGLMSGQIADFSCFSFHAVKNLTTAEGGAVTWKQVDGLDDDWLYKQLMLYSLHGQSKDALSKTKLGAWEYDIIYPAYKANMTDVLAGIGLSQIRRYDEMLKRRREIISYYDSKLIPFGMDVIDHYGDNHSSSGHLYFVRVPGASETQRNEIIVKLAEKGVASNVHYKPLPLFTAYKNLGFRIEDYPNAFNQYKNEITLPLYSKLKDDEIKYVADCFMQSVNEVMSDK